MTTEEFCNKQAELLNRLPMEFRDRVSYQAWESGHSSGYEEVLSQLVDLVDMLVEPISKYTANLKKSTP